MAPPAALPSILHRPALEERLDELFDKRLAVVVAGAGFGKSTLLAAWTADLECVWYTVTPQDNELGALTRGLGQSVRRRVRGLAPELSAALPAAGSESEERDRADAAAAQLCEALERLLTHDLVLVVDDLHELESAAASRLIESLCRQAPPILHIVLASRGEPPFPLDRMRGQGHVIELTSEELAFTRDEVEKLVPITLGDQDPEFAGFLYQATAGWPAAIRLGLEAVRRVAPDERKTAFERMRKPGGALFSYLASEVFDREPPEVRELLTAVAPFEPFTPGLCEALGFSRALEALTSLGRRGLFLQQASGGSGWFSLHALVREFVLERVAPKKLQALQRRAARWFEAEGQLPEALRAFTAAGDRSEVARFLKEHGTEVLGRGHVELIGRALSSLPEEAADAELEELRGGVELARNHPDAALACFERAFAGSATLTAAQARRMGDVHRMRGRHDSALEVYARGRLDGTSPRDEALLLSWAARSHYVVGDVDRCRESARESLERATALGDAEVLANAYRATAMLAQLEGDAITREAHMARALEYGEQGIPLPVQASDRVGQAIFDLERGLYADAIANAERALQLGELMGGSRIPHALAARGVAKAGLGRLDEALVDFEAARAVWEQMDSAWASAALSGLGDVFRERGDLSLAQAAYEQAIVRAEEGKLAHALAAPLAGLALVVAAQDRAEATRLVQRALSWPGPEHPWALVAAGWVAVAGGDRQEAAQYAEAAAAEARARRYRPALAKALELAAMSSTRPADSASDSASLLEEARAIWHDLQNPLAEAGVELALSRLSGGPGARFAAARAEHRLRRLGVRLTGRPAAGLLAFLPQEERPAVEVQCLGRFEVRRGGDELSWRSKKARDLLKILVARRGRPAPRELLIEALWPGEHPDRAANRLSVALSTVRATLDPDKRFDADHFVRVEKGVIELVRSSVAVDVDAFFGEAAAGFQLARDSRGEDAVERFEYAESVYVGDFLEEDRFEDWAESVREEARATYASVARAVAEHAGARGDYDAALRYLLRILEHDPYDEETHLAVARSLTIAGRHGEARRAYRRYVRRMEEIGVEPVPFLAASRHTAATERAAQR